MEPDYYNEYAEIQREHWWYQARAEILEAILHRHLGVSRQRWLLDLGCGPGGMRPMLSQFGRLVSTDVSVDVLRWCSPQRLDHLVVADAIRLPFGDGQVDAAAALDVIEHIRDDVGAAVEIRRVLKPGGLLVVTVPAFQFLWGRQDVVNHHYRRYRAGGLRVLLQRAGFAIEKLSYFNTFLFPPIAMIRLARRLTGLHQPQADQPMKSDFSTRHRGWRNELPRRIFSAEKALLLHGNLPVGVSLLAIARKPVNAATLPEGDGTGGAGSTAMFL